MHVWDPNPNRSRLKHNFWGLSVRGSLTAALGPLDMTVAHMKAVRGGKSGPDTRLGPHHWVGVKWSPFCFHGPNPKPPCDLFAGHLWTRTSFGPSTMCRYGRRGTEGGSSNCEVPSRICSGWCSAQCVPFWSQSLGHLLSEVMEKKNAEVEGTVFFRARAFLDFQHVSARCGTTAWMRSRPTFVTTSYYQPFDRWKDHPSGYCSQGRGAWDVPEVYSPEAQKDPRSSPSDSLETQHASNPNLPTSSNLVPFRFFWKLSDIVWNMWHCFDPLNSTGGGFHVAGPALECGSGHRRSAVRRRLQLCVGANLGHPGGSRKMCEAPVSAPWLEKSPGSMEVFQPVFNGLLGEINFGNESN